MMPTISSCSAWRFSGVGTRRTPAAGIWEAADPARFSGNRRSEEREIAAFFEQTAEGEIPPLPVLRVTWNGSVIACATAAR
jgi:hypothetical protein